MAVKKDYKKMTVGEFIETELFRTHLENVINDLLHGYNEFAKDMPEGKRFIKAPVINLIEGKLLDDTNKFFEEYRKVLNRQSDYSSSNRQCILEIGGTAIHNALASISKKDERKNS